MPHISAPESPGEDVGEKEHLIGGHPSRTGIVPTSANEPRILVPAAGEPARHGRVAEEDRGGVANVRMGHPGVRFGVLAEQGYRPLRVPAAAGDRVKQGDDTACESRHLAAEVGLVGSTGPRRDVGVAGLVRSS